MSESGKRLGRRMLIVSAGVLLSRVLGLIRDIVYANHWGTGTAFAAFVIAFTIPNLLRALFGEGAFSAAFVPVFSERLERDGRDAAWDAATRVLSVLLIAVSGIVLLIMALSATAAVFAQKDLDTITLRLLVWVMPYAVLICMTGAFAAVLNSVNHFTVPALTPIILNVFLIAATLVLCPLLGTTDEQQVFGLALAVLAAGVIQLGAQVWMCKRKGLSFRPRPDWHAPEVRRVVYLMAPALIGTGVAQLNVAVDRYLARCLGSAATSSLYYSQRLAYLPVGLFGVAMAVAALPAMSRAWVRQDVEDMRSSLGYALRQVLFLTLPITGLLAVVAVPVVRLLFERGSFDSQSTAETVWALQFYLPGIPAFACAKIAVTPFYARQDTKTPVRIAAFCLALNVVLNLSLMWWMRQAGLAIATSICSYVNVVLLLYMTHRHLGGLHTQRLLPAVLRIAAATLLATGVAVGTAQFLGTRPTPAAVRRLLDVAVPLAMGSLAYLAAAWCLHCAELKELVGAITNKLSRSTPQ